MGRSVVVVVVVVAVAVAVAVVAVAVVAVAVAVADADADDAVAVADDAVAVAVVVAVADDADADAAVVMTGTPLHEQKALGAAPQGAVGGPGRARRRPTAEETGNQRSLPCTNVFFPVASEIIRGSASKTV